MFQVEKSKPKTSGLFLDDDEEDDLFGSAPPKPKEQ